MTIMTTVQLENVNDDSENGEENKRKNRLLPQISYWSH